MIKLTLIMNKAIIIANAFESKKRVLMPNGTQVRSINDIAINKIDLFKDFTSRMNDWIHR